LETGDVVFTIVRVRARGVRHGAVLIVSVDFVFFVFAIVENAVFGAYLVKIAGNQFFPGRRAVAGGIIATPAPEQGAQA
jgi:uncharacterized membrane protein